MSQNILGFDYFFLMSFLWLVAGMDYQLSRTNRMIKVGKKNISFRVIMIRIAFLVLWFMAACRGLDVTNDIKSYYELYNKIAAFGPESIKRIEIGYVILNVFFSKLIANSFVGFRVMLLFTTAIGYSAVEQWIERHAQSYGVCLIAYYFLIDSTFMSANRQMLAMGVALWALMYWEKGKGWKKIVIYYLMVLLASTFHQTAIICALFPIINKLKYTKTTPFWILVTTVLATGTNFVNILVTKVGMGTEYLTTDIGNATNVTIISILYIALLLLRRFIQPEQYIIENNSEISNLGEDFYTYCIIFALAVTIMSLRAPGMNRMAMYLQIVGLPYISNTISKIKYSKAKLIIKLIFGLAIWGYSAIALIYRPEWQHLWPYHFFWNY